MAGWTCDRILTPIDFSEPSWRCLVHAARVASSPAALHVLHVLPTIHPGEPGIAAAALDDDRRIKEAHHFLRKQLADRGYEGAQPHVTIGDPGRQITETARAIDAELIVIGSHGRTGLKHLLIGSVAERVARLGPCPVLIVRREG